MPWPFDMSKVHKNSREIFKKLCKMVQILKLKPLRVIIDMTTKSP